PDAGRVLLPPGPAPVDRPVRRGGLDARLRLDRDAARDRRRRARRALEPRAVPRPELRLGPQVRERGYRVPAGERGARAPGSPLARAGDGAGRRGGPARPPRALTLP